MNSTLRLYFRTEDSSIPSIILTAQHRRLWKYYGADITKAFKIHTGVSFMHGVRIRVGVKDYNNEYLGWSHSGVTGRKAVTLYYLDGHQADPTILGELLHELGHRLLGQHKLFLDWRKTGMSVYEDNYETHRVLFSMLIPVIQDVFDKDTVQAIYSNVDERYSIEPSNNSPDSLLRSFHDAWQWTRALPSGLHSKQIKALFKQHEPTLPS